MKSTAPALEGTRRAESTGTIHYTNKPGYAEVSTGDSSPRADSDSWDGTLGYPDLEIDDTEYVVTWYRWVMVILFSLFNINCAIQIIGYNTLAAQLVTAFDI